MKIRIGMLALLLGIAAAVFSPTGVYGEERVYTVQKGETLYSIARTLGVKAEDLMKHNGITDPARLQAGQRLSIPGSGAGVSAAAPASPAAAGSGAPQTYRVVRGDTLYSIARKFSVSVASIRELNNFPENHILREGAALKLPVDARIPAESWIPTESRIPETAGTQGAGRTNAGPRTEPRGTETRPVNPSVRWPVAAQELSYMTGKLSGVVITGARDEPVQSLTRGTVLSAGPFQGFSRVVIIQVDGGYLYVYGGCESLSVKEGDRVGPGTELGKLGIDAVSNKPQLFFMVYRSNTPVDPAKAPRA